MYLDDMKAERFPVLKWKNGTLRAAFFSDFSGLPPFLFTAYFVGFNAQKIDFLLLIQKLSVFR